MRAFLQSGAFPYESFTVKSTDISEQVNEIAYNGSNLYVAVCLNGTIWSSADAITWTQRADVNSTSRIIYANSLWVTNQPDGYVYTSPNGTSWTQRSLGATYDVGPIIYDNSLFVAVGQNGLIYTSTDGLSWTNRSVSTGTYDFTGVCWTGTKFIAIGQGGICWTSSNGTSWTEEDSLPEGISWKLAYSSTLGIAVAIESAYDTLNSEYVLVARWSDDDGASWSEAFKYSRTVPYESYGSIWKVKWMTDNACFLSYIRHSDSPVMQTLISYDGKSWQGHLSYYDIDPLGWVERADINKVIACGDNTIWEHSY